MRHRQLLGLGMILLPLLSAKGGAASGPRPCATEPESQISPELQDPACKIEDDGFCNDAEGKPTDGQEKLDTTNIPVCVPRSCALVRVLGACAKAYDHQTKRYVNSYQRAKGCVDEENRKKAEMEAKGVQYVPGACLGVLKGNFDDQKKQGKICAEQDSSASSEIDASKAAAEDQINDDNQYISMLKSKQEEMERTGQRWYETDAPVYDANGNPVKKNGKQVTEKKKVKWDDNEHDIGILQDSRDWSQKQIEKLKIIRQSYESCSKKMREYADRTLKYPLPTQ